MIGQRLGAYEVLAKLGEGGMGEVYRARDAKLNRDVAIKVLPERLAEDPAALARFEREAQAVAALSHPNILAIHDFGTAAGVTYAVTELLEGDTLRARMADGALPTRKAVDYGVHIVLGIAAAHSRGIVHRDLKPENIFITRDGVVKILDFGLAKADGDGKDDRTKIADTTPGTVMGTVGYMSPEQVRAQPIDHRTDIFSFGAIFYEMLTGRRAFRGDSQVETMNAILKEDPPEFAEVNPNLPGSLDRIIRRCLEKQPSDRFHSAHDLAIALEALSGSTNQSASTIAARATESMETPARKGGISPLLAAAAIAIVGAAAFFRRPCALRQRCSRAARVQETHVPPRPDQFGPHDAGRPTFVYSAAFDAPVRSVYTTRADSPESAELPYSDPIVTAISPKGELALIMKRRNITGYSVVGTLARASLSGGATRDLLEDVQDADWLPDGSDLVVAHAPDNRYRLEWPIGKAVYETDGWISHVRVSPDGRHVAFLDHPSMGDDRGNAAVIDASGKKQVLGGTCDSTQGLAWTPSGSEIWFTCAHGGSASRQLLGVTLAGAIRTILRVPGSLTLGDIAADGSALVINNTDRRGMIALAPGETQERDLSWLDWTQPVALSDDGKTVLITEEAEGGGPGYTVYLRKTDGSPAIKLGPGEAVALSRTASG
jgi:tRNA A-37 threonylcarbamoyl transferase component Bud32